MKHTLYGEQATRVQEHLRRCGEEVSARYLPAEILPQWDRFLSRVFAGRTLEGAEIGASAPPRAPVSATEES